MEKRKGSTKPSYQDGGGLLWKCGCMCMFVCAMSHEYVAKGCTAHLCDVCLLSFPFSHLLLELSSPSPSSHSSLPLSSSSSPLLSILPLPLPPLSSLLPSLLRLSLLHFLLQLFAPTQLDSLAMMFSAVLSCGHLPTLMKMASNLVSIFGVNGQLLNPHTIHAHIR